MPLFPDGYRAAGLLLHITSLPSPYGIGDLGPAAFTWIDRLRDAEQSWWQALPLGPTGYGNSPYQCLSSFVGNGLLISPEFLIEDGLLKEDDCEGVFFRRSDYDTVIPFKHRLLDTAWTNFRAGVRKDLVSPVRTVLRSRASWLDDYALFRALKEKYSSSSYLEWPKELVQRIPSALTQARRELSERDRQGSTGAIPAIPAGNAPERVCPHSRCAADWRSALFRFPRLERRLG
jgi:4-alpha-glucanotransferase